MDQQHVTSIQHHLLYPDLPERPGWQIESLMELGAALDEDSNAQSIRNAASSVHESWMQWSLKIEQVLLAMGDIILRLEIPESYVVGLIETVSHFPTKPSLPNDQSGDHWPESTAQDLRQHLDNDWESWADWIQGFYDSIGLLIFRFRDFQVSVPFRHCASPRSNVESLNIADLSISERATAIDLCDPRRIFRNLLELQEDPGTRTNTAIPRQLQESADRSIRGLNVAGLKISETPRNLEDGDLDHEVRGVLEPMEKSSDHNVAKVDEAANQRKLQIKG